MNGWLIRAACFLRGLSVLILYPFWITLICILTVIAGFLPAKLSKPIQDSLVETWSHTTLWWFGIHVKVEGQENVIPGEPVLFVFNHTSLIDIVVIHSVFPSPRFGAKAELFKIPFFGRAMRAAGALPIERARRDKVFQVYKEAETRFANGESFILAPEGTRQSGEQLGAFKSGPFIFAINAKVRVVPLVLIDVHKVLPKDKLMPNLDRWKRPVTMKVLKPLDARKFSIEDRPVLQGQAFEVMTQAYQPSLN